MAKDDKTNKDINGSAASALPLFYQSPMPLDGKRHGDLSLKRNFGFAFTQTVNAVPVNLIEMPQVCHYYPIAFSPDANATPVAVLGLRDNENLFALPKGEWAENAYISAYIRRYPFIFSELPGSEQLTLCVDNNPDVLEKSSAQPFFEKDGKPTDLSQNALKFCKSYHAAAQQTLAFGKEIAASGILIEREAQVNISGNRRINFSGFKIIDERKLAVLEDKVFLDWRKKGYLPFIYAHLFSGAQWQRLSRMLSERLEKEAA